ncbi:MAG: OB-fold nucleic acid binding domain-containing protein, partial [Candidatus Heimdallarchaeaceae archaeon]
MSQFVSPPAIIVYIYDLINGTLRTDPENPFQMAILTKNGELIERVRIVGTIVDKYHSEGIEGKKDYTMLSVDDGTGVIAVKAWELSAAELNRFEKGEQIDVIGKPRGNDEEIFILPEIPMKVE